MTDIEYIRSKLSMQELLEQVSKEAEALSLAALKLGDAIDTTTPTPEMVQECMDDFNKELADVLNATIVAFPQINQKLPAPDRVYRWAVRLGKEANHV